MRHSWLLVPCVCVIVIGTTLAHSNTIHKVISDAALEVALLHHLPHLTGDVPERHHGTIRRMIDEHLTLGRRDAEITLGRAEFYFPIFERPRAARQLPEALKLAPLEEPRLRVQATSSAGARGLWQFMEGTAQAYQLKITETEDERLDPVRSTKAAARLLSDLHAQFGDWLLALAAYNCGPGNVQKAIRLGGSTDYWEIEQHLPRQTQRYIPTFIAVAYVAAHYEQHGLNPRPFRPAATARPVAQPTKLPTQAMRQLNLSEAQKGVVSDANIASGNCPALAIALPPTVFAAHAVARATSDTLYCKYLPVPSSRHSAAQLVTTFMAGPALLLWRRRDD